MLDRSPPLFSIGVATFKRPALLRETLESILANGFADFEVVVGNNDPEAELSEVTVGLADPRIRYLNHGRNLGQIANMNAILAAAGGKYFTWLNDDDLHSPILYESAARALREFPGTKVLYSDFQPFGHGKEVARWAVKEVPTACWSGQEFLRRYLNRQIKLIGCYGFYDTDYIRGRGGFRDIGSPRGLYSDHLIAVEAGLQEKVVYLDAPLCFLRHHVQSFSSSSQDMQSYLDTQRGLRKEALLVLRSVACRADFGGNFYGLAHEWLTHFAMVAARSPLWRSYRAFGYLPFLWENTWLLRGDRRYFIKALKQFALFPAYLAKYFYVFKIRRAGPDEV